MVSFDIFIFLSRNYVSRIFCALYFKHVALKMNKSDL